MDPDEVPVSLFRFEKAVRMKYALDRKRSLAGGIISRIIMEENGQSEDDIRYEKSGKPISDKVFFNISHSGDYAIGVYGPARIGCDIELIRKHPEALKKRIFNEKELEFIENVATASSKMENVATHPDKDLASIESVAIASGKIEDSTTASDRDLAFFYLWTLRESLLKMNGVGIAGLKRHWTDSPDAPAMGNLPDPPVAADFKKIYQKPLVTFSHDKSCFFFSFLYDRHIISVCENS